MVQTGWTHGRGRAVAGMLCRPQGACSVDTAPCFVKLGMRRQGELAGLVGPGSSSFMRRPLANAVLEPRKQGAVRASPWCDLDDCVWHGSVPECLSSAGAGGRERRGWWEECLPIRTDHVGASALRLMRACHQQPKPGAATGGPLLTTTEWESGRNVEQQQCRATGTRQSDFRDS